MLVLIHFAAAVGVSRAKQAYAEGVELQSPGSPRSGAPWVTVEITLYAEGVIQIAAKSQSLAQVCVHIARSTVRKLTSGTLGSLKALIRHGLTPAA